MGLYWYRVATLGKFQHPKKYPGMSRWGVFDRGVAHLMMDRTMRVQTPLRMKMEPSSAIPDPASHAARTFEECCYERADELVRKAEVSDKPLYLLFSGGVDSTTVAVSFLKNFSHARLKNILKIVTSTEAWIENPNFVRNHLLGKFEFISAHSLGHFTDGRALLVTGEMNEYYLFTSQSHVDQVYSRDTLHAYLRSINIDEVNARAWTEVLDAERSRAPVETAMLTEFLWWMRFNWTWQYYKFQFLMTINTNTSRISSIGEFTERVHHFFDSPAFQIWGMSNPDRSWRKTPCRKLILEYTKDAAWVQGKRKFRSLINILRDKKMAIGIDEKFNVLYSFDDLMKFYEPENDFR